MLRSPASRITPTPQRPEPWILHRSCTPHPPDGTIASPEQSHSSQSSSRPPSPHPAAPQAMKRLIPGRPPTQGTTPGPSVPIAPPTWTHRPLDHAKCRPIAHQPQAPASSERATTKSADKKLSNVAPPSRNNPRELAPPSSATEKDPPTPSKTTPTYPATRAPASSDVARTVPPRLTTPQAEPHAAMA